MTLLPIILATLAFPMIWNKERIKDLQYFKSTATTTTTTQKSKEVVETDCTFESPHSEAPVPLILMSLGRSGSSVTWNTLSTMLGSTTVAYEITGGNRTTAEQFFDDIESSVGTNWAIKRLCQIQKRNMAKYDNPVISGFQWKP